MASGQIGGMPDWGYEAYTIHEQANHLADAATRTMHHLKGGQAGPGTTEEILNALVRFLERVRKEPTPGVLLEQMNKGFGALDHQLAKIQGKLPTAGSVTYRDVVVKGMDSGARPTGGPRTSPAHNKNAEVVVKIDDKEAARALKDMGPTKLTEKANLLIDHLKAGLPVRAARPLRSGDISFTAANEKEAEKLRENTEWAKSMGEKARIAAPVFGVLVHGAPANGTLPMRDGRLLQKEAIEYIKKENKIPVYEPG
ncbi:hypothetical protein N7G274_000062 [Stereocaulon virgatum]|uniref:Uncharacterized protein n=1 Tax=Stereocaulon virgatum TaxID=373712 RepID=A0ABR4ATU4_9LECA